MLFADFHFHSKYSRAVSPAMNLEGLADGARVKGLSLLGTGDFSHPAWLAEMKRKLESREDGFFVLRGRKDSPLYTLTNEIATIVSTPDGVKKVHHVLHAPSFDVVDQLNEQYGKRGNLAADGRPVIGGMPSEEFAEMTFGVCRDVLLYPAHAWTPWFAALGSNSGYDSLEECYGSQARNIVALETGMSSNPSMNWRVSSLDKYALLSNSDSHSPHPWRLGRECNAFSFSTEEVTYEKIIAAVRTKNKQKFLYTVETSPSYGKYHFDGHRNCGFSCAPEETRKLGGLCPVCKRPLTIGVLNRVEELADRPEGFVPQGTIPFRTLLPLHELVAAALGSSLASKKTAAEAAKLMALGSELSILLDVDGNEIKRKTTPEVSAAIALNRLGRVDVKPGFDGEYGVPLLGKERKEKRWKPSGSNDPQKQLLDY